MLKFQRNGASVSVKKSKNVYSIEYPCALSYDCSSIESTFPPGFYHIELYGASGGHEDGFISTYIDPETEFCSDSNVSMFKGNTKCTNVSSMAGAGGYTSAFLTLQRSTKIYIAIGGKGTYTYGTSETSKTPFEDSLRPKGGFNGGGKGSLHTGGSSGGGGATDFRLYNDDLWHRVIVSGGGGGSDNESPSSPVTSDDGRGGAGGGLIAQGPWIDHKYQSSFVATQEKGFTFGNGEAAQESGSKSPQGIQSAYGGLDRAGAGGGWFGGFSGHNQNGGGGGGSSFAFTSDAYVPSGNIESTDEYYNNPISKPYQISQSTSFTISSPIFVAGIWDGDGMARITALHFYKRCTKPLPSSTLRVLTSLMILISS